MSTILNSTMSTYLLDEEAVFEVEEQSETVEVEQRTQYPKGFFSSL
jgi:hypothetical protein